MGLFWTLYGALSAGFLAGAATYLWRWKQPPEVITEQKTSIIQTPPQVQYVKEGPEIVRCVECRYYGYAAEDGVARLRCLHYDRQTMPDAFCSAGERPPQYVPRRYYDDAYANLGEAYRNYCSKYTEYNMIKNLEE